MTDFDTDYTRKPVCPHCGYIMRDTTDLDSDDEETCEIECGDCEKPYEVTTHVRVTYSTLKVSR